MVSGGDAQPDPGDVPDMVNEELANADRSLLDDIGNLVGDAQTWFDAELSYQKVRAAFVGASLKQTVVLGVAAVVLLLVAVLGLTFGLILALAPLVTAWGATAIVVGLLLLLALMCGRGASAAWRDVLGAVHDQDDDA